MRGVIGQCGVAGSEAGPHILIVAPVRVRNEACAHCPQLFRRDISWDRPVVQHIAPREHHTRQSRPLQAPTGTVAVRHMQHRDRLSTGTIRTMAHLKRARVGPQ
jgi:hypothetical protein